jgi:hypothetical protein
MDDSKAYKNMIDKLASKLREYQMKMPLEEHQIEAQMLQDLLAGVSSNADGKADLDQAGIDHLVGAHLLSPLFVEYERTISALSAELKTVKAELNRKFQLERDLVNENELL